MGNRPTSVNANKRASSPHKSGLLPRTAIFSLFFTILFIREKYNFSLLDWTVLNADKIEFGVWARRRGGGERKVSSFRKTCSL